MYHSRVLTGTLLYLAACSLTGLAAPANSAASMALVGGRLIDGFGGTPLDHSVVLTPA
jgi:hypothetical protein